MPQAIGELILEAAYWVAGAGAEAGASAAASTAVGTSITWGQIVGTLALEAASIGVGAALAPSPNPQSQKVNVRSPVAARRRGYGTVKIGGVLSFIRRSTVTGDGILYLDVMIHSGEIDAYVEHYIFDQVTRIDEDGSRTGIVGAAVYPGVWLDNNRVTLHTYLGLASQASDDLLQAAFPGAWTGEHRLDGIAHVVIKANGVALEDFGDVYKAGIPTYMAIVRASKLWDPRISGCDADDPSTWVWSDNAALIIMDYLWHNDGMRLPRALIERAIDRWITVADCCDELVPLLNGDTEKRYRLSGVYDFSEAPKNVLARMLLPIDGRLHLRADGAIVLDIGEFCEPVVTITEDDIISYDGLRRGPSKIDLKNEIRATYSAPGLKYEQQEADPWRNETSVLVDGAQSVTLNLDWCPSQSQARRRMKVEDYRKNPEWQGAIVTNAKGAQLLGLRYGRFQIASLGIDATFFIQRADIDLINGICTFEVVSFPAAAYDFDPETEEGISPEANAPGDHGIVIPTGATELEIVADGAGGGGSDRGGGAGARSRKIIAIDPADWGSVIYYTVGDHGIGEAVNVIGGVMTDGGDSTVTGTVTAGAINMVAGGGEKGTNTPGAGGIASGGDININGGNGHGPDGGTAASGAEPNEFPGGGGDLQMDGGNGSVTFLWSYVAAGTGTSLDFSAAANSQYVSVIGA